MVEQTENFDKEKKLLRKKRRNGIRAVLTWTLIFVGGALVLGVVAGTILEIPALNQYIPIQEKIHHITTLVFTTCVGLLCLVLGFERKVEFDNIETTLEKQNETLEKQNKHFDNSESILKGLKQGINESSTDSKSLVQKMDELIAKIKPPTILKEIDWKLLIKQADKIDFLVQGWDGWMDHHSTELEDFFRRSGQFSLFVVNAEGEEASYVRKLMEKRLEKSANQVEVEITNTISNIQGIFNEVGEANSKKKLEVFRLNEVNWYFAAQFKSQASESRDVLVLSLYSHHKYLLKETPVIILYRDAAPSVFKWFDAELNKLKLQSTKNS